MSKKKQNKTTKTKEKVIKPIKTEETTPKKEIITNKKYQVKKTNKSKEKVYAIACIILIIDQLVKILIKTKMTLNQEIPVIPNFFSLFYVENKGAAFSILQNQSFLLIIISVACLYFLDRFLTKENSITKFQRIALGLVMGGMLGNLIDRLLYQHVVDYLSFTFFKYSFAIFNLADIGITVGVVLLIISIIKEEVDTKKLAKKKK